MAYGVGDDDHDDDHDDQEVGNFAISPFRRSLMPDDGAVTDVSSASARLLHHGARTVATPGPTLVGPRVGGVDPPRPPREGFE